MLYWVLLIFIVVGFFYPIIGLLAIVCMVAPVVLSVFKGRYWCGHYCPRGSYYDKLISRVSRNRKIPDFVRSEGFRLFMLFFIFAVFGVQMYFAWGDWGAMGGVFCYYRGGYGARYNLLSKSLVYVLSDGYPLGEGSTIQTQGYFQEYTR